MTKDTTIELTKLAERWEREAKIAMGNYEVLGPIDPTTAEMCRTAHGYLLHCAGELRDIIGVARVLDERAERVRAIKTLEARKDLQ